MFRKCAVKDHQFIHLAFPVPFVKVIYFTSITQYMIGSAPVDIDLADFFFAGFAELSVYIQCQVLAVISADSINPPPLVATMNYSTKIKTEAIMRLGFYRAMRNVSKLFRKSANCEGEEALRALKDATRRMKRETGKSVAFHLKDYRENLKFTYLFKLAEASSDGFAQTVLDRFQAYFSDLSATIERIGTSQKDKSRAEKILSEMDQISRQLNKKLDLIRTEIAEAS